MKYREFGRLGWKVSALGFGAMRLPIIGRDSSKIDEEPAIEMIRYAIDHGVNYLDTAYVYHRGEAEVTLGKALKDGYRERVRIATKMPVRLVEKREDLDEYFNRIDMPPTYWGTAREFAAELRQRWEAFSAHQLSAAVGQ